MKRHHFLLLCLWIFTGPTNLFWKILPNYGFVGGLQIDYLIPKLYLFDLVCLTVLLTFVFEKKLIFFFECIKHHWFTLGLVGLFFVRQLFTEFPIAAIWFFVTAGIRVCTVGVLWQWYKKINGTHLSKLVLIPIVVTLLFQSMLGIYQFVTQHQLVGFLFFGEPTLTHPVGLSKTSFSSFGLRTLPYGTTPHPNILAGTIVILMFTLLISKHNKWVTSAIIAVSLITLFLTQSVSAWLSLIITLVFVLSQNRSLPKSNRMGSMGLLLLIAMSLIGAGALSLFPHLDENPSLFRRITLNAASLKMISEHWLFGVGLNQWTTKVENYYKSQEAIRFVQPVHQSLLLLFAENGGIGVALGILFSKMLFLKKSSALLRKSLIVLSVVLPLVTFDHYLYTLPQGQFLIGLLFLVI